ncbi:protein adenylyltransferase SelO [Actimicrobium sp. CCI2.3]|uniref:protein adenylyltransferase SelO n=1 Tax=Actimicrobium sp. CCI2.3 TaxID=3048616 RepID=UPI002AB40E41|nr:YdiU family protein [Actimicrobium sp. CCI2.3]MDY7574352.1 YdiU family protein [Actimicrobium sp. CCI2.3]MEB0023513.1 YdiU family protein [Actimicrobium sp. CCI2.3]
MTLPKQTRTSTLDIAHHFADLPDAFFTHLMPTPLAKPYLVCASASAAALINFDPAEFTTTDFIDTFTGNRIADAVTPLAAVYSGHQFGVWAGQLGDGRAILLGDVPSTTGRMELQLKGAGPTPYSRGGDGRAVLRSSIREFLCSEAMAGLGIPTTRALCVTGSNQLVMREAPETTAVTTRMAPSFIRFGSFEHWYQNDQPALLRALADHVIDVHYPEARSDANPYAALLTSVTRRTAQMVAHWQAVGFMHGVMNTDNMSILGLTLDYGPFGFMDGFDPSHICNHTDQQGRYAYARQPQIAHWNCYALGQALLPLIGTVEETEAALANFKPDYDSMMAALLQAKLGLASVQPDDTALVDSLFAILQAGRVDFTLFFRRLGELQRDRPESDAPLRDLFIERAAFDAWATAYRQRLQHETRGDTERRLAMHAVNPKYVLRNHLAQVAIEKAQSGDYSEVARLLAILEKPFDDQPEFDNYAALPPDWASQLEVSCSS